MRLLELFTVEIGGSCSAVHLAVSSMKHVKKDDGVNFTYHPGEKLTVFSIIGESIQ